MQRLLKVLVSLYILNIFACPLQAMDNQRYSAAQATAQQDGKSKQSAKLSAADLIEITKKFQSLANIMPLWQKLPGQITKFSRDGFDSLLASTLVEIIASIELKIPLEEFYKISDAIIVGRSHLSDKKLTAKDALVAIYSFLCHGDSRALKPYTDDNLIQFCRNQIAQWEKVWLQFVANASIAEIRASLAQAVATQSPHWPYGQNPFALFLREALEMKEDAPKAEAASKEAAKIHREFAAKRYKFANNQFLSDLQKYCDGCIDLLEKEWQAKDAKSASIMADARTINVMKFAKAAMPDAKCAAHAGPEEGKKVAQAPMSSVTSKVQEEKDRLVAAYTTALASPVPVFVSNAVIQTPQNGFSFELLLQQNSGKLQPLPKHAQAAVNDALADGPIMKTSAIRTDDLITRFLALRNANYLAKYVMKIATDGDKPHRISINLMGALKRVIHYFIENNYTSTELLSKLHEADEDMPQGKDGCIWAQLKHDLEQGFDTAFSQDENYDESMRKLFAQVNAFPVPADIRQHALCIDAVRSGDKIRVAECLKHVTVIERKDDFGFRLADYLNLHELNLPIYSSAIRKLLLAKGAKAGGLWADMQEEEDAELSGMAPDRVIAGAAAASAFVAAGVARSMPPGFSGQKFAARKIE